MAHNLTGRQVEALAAAALYGSAFRRIDGSTDSMGSRAGGAAHRMYEKLKGQGLLRGLEITYAGLTRLEADSDLVLSRYRGRVVERIAELKPELKARAEAETAEREDADATRKARVAARRAEREASIPGKIRELVAEHIGPMTAGVFDWHPEKSVALWDAIVNADAAL